MSMENPNPVDIHVGLRLQAARKGRGFSQETLANAVGVSFQQVQKYEKGANRISCSRLWQFSAALEVSITYFFEGLERNAPEEKGFLTVDEVRAAKQLGSIENPRVRHQLLRLIHVCASNGNTAEG